MSRKARYVRLKVTARDGLVVTVPALWRGNLDAVLASKSEWIDCALAKVEDRRALYAAGPEALLPDAVAFCGDSYVVEYVGARRRPTVVAEDGVLVVSGVDPSAQLVGLRTWLSAEAKRALPERLDRLAKGSDVRPEAVRVRAVRSRWGSCTASGNIMLNRDLVFLPTHLSDSVIYHELAHLSVLNHSARFYAVLERLNPEWKSHRAELRAGARSMVPAWADA